MALAPPPPLQTPATPIFPSFTLNTDVNVVTILAPELSLVNFSIQSTIQVDVPMQLPLQKH
jgi:hypothetical protein